MTEMPTLANPFQLMMNPAAVLAAMEQSEQLGKLNRQLCRPLDRPGMVLRAFAAADQEIDDDLDDDSYVPFDEQ